MVRYRNLYCGVCAGGGSRKETVLDKYNGAVSFWLTIVLVLAVLPEMLCPAHSFARLRVRVRAQPRIVFLDPEVSSCPFDQP